MEIEKIPNRPTSIDRSVDQLLAQIPFDAMEALVDWAKSVPPSFELQLNTETELHVGGPSTLKVHINNQFIAAELWYSEQNDKLELIEVRMS
jgi:hypothetical protein